MSGPVAVGKCSYGAWEEGSSCRRDAEFGSAPVEWPVPETHTWRHLDSCWTNESGALAGMGRGTDLGVKKRRVGGGWPQTGQGVAGGRACNEALRFRNKQSLSEEEAIPSSL